MSENNTENTLDEIEIDPPMTPEEEAKWKVKMWKMSLAWRRELRQTNGPRKVRERKNQRYLAMLIRKHTEPVLRGILKAMSKANDLHGEGLRLLCVQFLTETDLDQPLEKLIAPFNDIYRNRPIRIVEVNGPEYIVEIHGGGGTAGDGGTFLLVRDGDIFRIKEQLDWWIN